MDSQRAVEHLQEIRTLMERSAVYRRALAPVTLIIGLWGTLAAGAAWALRIRSSAAFVLYWFAISGVALVCAFLLIRWQALKEAEPFWSPPMRRVVQALGPPLFIGLVVGLLVALPHGSAILSAWWLPPAWMVLYGSALHAAGFFMERGIKWFGWGFVLAGSGMLFWVNSLGSGSGWPSLVEAHWLMGGAFGGLHLAYSVYLYFTEERVHEP